MDYTENLYTWMIGADSSFEDKMSLLEFNNKMTNDDIYLEKIYNWLGTRDDTFQQQLSLDVFKSKIRGEALPEIGELEEVVDVEQEEREKNVIKTEKQAKEDFGKRAKKVKAQYEEDKAALDSKSPEYDLQLEKLDDSYFKSKEREVNRYKEDVSRIGVANDYKQHDWMYRQLGADADKQQRSNWVFEEGEPTDMITMLNTAYPGFESVSLLDLPGEGNASGKSLYDQTQIVRLYAPGYDKETKKYSAPGKGDRKDFIEIELGLENIDDVNKQKAAIAKFVNQHQDEVGIKRDAEGEIEAIIPSKEFVKNPIDQKTKLLGEFAVETEFDPNNPLKGGVALNAHDKVTLAKLYGYYTTDENGDEVFIPATDDSIFIEDSIKSAHVSGLLRALNPETLFEDGSEKNNISGPYEKELRYSKEYLTKKNAALGKKAPTGQEVKDFAREIIYGTEKAKILDSHWDQYLYNHSDKRKALLTLYNIKTTDKKLDTAVNLQILNDIELDNYSKVNPIVQEFNAIYNDPTREFEILMNVAGSGDWNESEEVVTLKNGKKISRRELDLYTRAAEKQGIIWESLIARRDKIWDIQDEVGDLDASFDLLRRDYDMWSKNLTTLGMGFADIGTGIVYLGGQLVTSAGKLGAGAQTLVGELMGDEALTTQGKVASQVWQELDTDFAELGEEYIDWKNEIKDTYARDIQFNNAFKTGQNFGRFVAQEVSTQIPILATMALSGGTAAPWVIGAYSAGQHWMEMEAEDLKPGAVTRSEWVKAASSIGYGAAEMVFESLTTIPILKRGKSLLTAKGGRSMLDYTNAIKQHFKENGKYLLFDPASEAIGEGATQITQNLIDGRPVLEGVDHAMFSGGMMGGGMSAAPFIYGAGMRAFSDYNAYGKYRARADEMADLRFNLNSLEQQFGEKQIDKMNVEDSSTLISVKEGLTENIERLESENRAELEKLEGDLSSRLSGQAFNQFNKLTERQENIRQKVEKLLKNKFIKGKARVKLLESYKKEFDSAQYLRDIWRNEESFGNEFTMLKETDTKRWEEITLQAESEIRGKRGLDESTTLDNNQVQGKAYEIFANQEIVSNYNKAKANNNNKEINLKLFTTNDQAIDAINQYYDGLVGEDGKISEAKEKERKNIIDKITAGTLNGFDVGSIKGKDAQSWVFQENAAKNERMHISTHEPGHAVFRTLLSDKSADFDYMADAIVEHLQKIDPALWQRMQARGSMGAKVQYNEKGEAVDVKYSSEEVVMNFLEEVAAEKVDFKQPKMKKFAGLFGFMANKSMEKATNGKYNIDFAGETDVINFLVSLGTKLKEGTLTETDLKDAAESEVIKKGIKEKEARIERETKEKEEREKKEAAIGRIQKSKESVEEQGEMKASDVSGSLYQRTDKIYDSNQPLADKGFEIGQIWKNEIKSRITKGYRLGKQYLKPTTWDGWNESVMEDILSDTTTGGSGIPGLVKSYANRGPKFKNMTLAAWINDKLNQRITGYLPNDLVGSDMSIDSETARQIEDVKAGKFDEDITTVVDEKGRDLKKFEELDIITPELVDNIKNILINKLKKLAITKGFSQDVVNAEIESIITKEITKVIKKEMGPITKNILGFAPQQYIDFINNNMETIIGAMPIDIIKQKAKSKDWGKIFKLKKIGKEEIKKVNPDVIDPKTGKPKVTYYAKDIFEVEKPNPREFTKYFTRGKYTTLIAKQKSLIQPIAKEIAKTELFKLKQNDDFINDLAQRTGMTAEEVSTMYIDNVLDNMQEVLDQTAGEQRSQDVVKFSDTLAGASLETQIEFMKGLRSPEFKAQLARNLDNQEYLGKLGKQKAISKTIREYFIPNQTLEGLTDKQIKKIATDFSGPTIGKQVEKEAEIVTKEELADIISEAFVRGVEMQTDYKAIELVQGIINVDFDPKSLQSINIGRKMALKIAQKIGRQKFERLFAPGFSGPGGLGGLMVTQPSGIEISESSVVGVLPTTGIQGKAVQRKKGDKPTPIIYSGTKAQVKLMGELLSFKGIEFKNRKGDLVIPEIKDKDGRVVTLKRVQSIIEKGGRQGSGLFLNKTDLDNNVLNAKDANGNFLVKDSEVYIKDKDGEIIEDDKGKVVTFVEGNYNNKVINKNWYFSKKWGELDGNKKDQLEFVNEIAEEGDINNKIFQETIESLAGELTPSEARWLVHVASADMAGAIKASASLIGFPTLNKKQLQESLNLDTKDQYVLEHMSPAKYIALLTYKYLLDPKGPNNKSNFNTALDNFNTIILPKGQDDILTEIGLKEQMGLFHKIGDSPFETRYREILKVMELTLKDGTTVGQTTTNFSEANNTKPVQEFNSELINDSGVKPSNTDQNTGISIIETQILDKALNIARDPNAAVKKIRVFDFDDTLARTKSKVNYTMRDGKTGKLTAEEFAEKGDTILEEGGVFDFSEFNEVVDGKPGPLLEVAKQIQEARGTEDVFVLTARGQEAAPAIKQFLDSLNLNIPLENITGLGDSSPLAKSSWMVDKASQGYNDFYFADDAFQNVKAVKKALSPLDVKAKVQQAKEAVQTQINKLPGESNVKFSLDTKRDLKWEHTGGSVTFANFEVEGKEYKIELYNEDRYNYNVWFGKKEAKGHTTAITGDGNAAQVLSIVSNGVIDFIKTLPDIQTLNFGAKEKSRARLYKTLAELWARKLGWSLDTKTPTDIAGSFELRREAKPWPTTKTQAPAVSRAKFSESKPVQTVLNAVDVKYPTQESKIKFSDTVDQVMNDIIYDKTGIESYKEYSGVKGKKEGKKRKTFRVIPYSAEDFGGLLYKLLGKGEKGNAQWAWMKEHLINPFARAMNDMSIARNDLMTNFRALKKSMKDIPNLKKKAFRNFSYEDVVRIGAWNKQGVEIDGLSKKDLKDVQDFLKENPELQTFVDQLIVISKSTGYAYPGTSWEAGTITTDLIHGLDNVLRPKLLEQWQANIDLAFSEKNLNKLEAAFGKKFREALEDSIRRMKTGKNRQGQMSRLEARFLDWVNNSVGAVMFINARSAVLQTISAINFLNWTDNNPMKAAKAFSNQKQYWKDFMTLMNSDYLVDRRNGLRINVSESEIAAAASKDGVQGVFSFLLKKGFVLTQIADSFAIASGGSTFYRNRIESYMKETNPDTGKKYTEKEAIEKTFFEFREISEENQQSSRPDKISQQQASSLGRVILAFANTPSQYTRIIEKSVLDLANGRGDYKTNISKIMYYGMVQNIIFNALSQAVFALGFGDDEEDKKVKEEKYFDVANGMLDSLLKGTGISGAIAAAIKNLIIELHEKVTDPSWKGMELEETAYNLLDVSPTIDIHVSKWRQGMNTWEYGQDLPEAKDPFNIHNPAYEAIAKIITSTTNVPLDRLLQKIYNIEGAMDSTNATWKRIAMFLGWPEYQLASSLEKEESIAIKKAKVKSVKEGRKGRIYKPKKLPVLDSEEVDKTPDSILDKLMVNARKKKAKDKADTKEYKDLTKEEQIEKLDSLGLSQAQIRALKYEEDRVKKLLELMD